MQWVTLFFNLVSLALPRLGFPAQFRLLRLRLLRLRLGRLLVEQ
jgi:hypothetical protein